MGKKTHKIANQVLEAIFIKIAEQNSQHCSAICSAESTESCNNIICAHRITTDYLKYKLDLEQQHKKENKSRERREEEEEGKS